MPLNFLVSYIVVMVAAISLYTLCSLSFCSGGACVCLSVCVCVCGQCSYKILLSQHRTEEL